MCSPKVLSSFGNRGSVRFALSRTRQKGNAGMSSRAREGRSARLLDAVPLALAPERRRADAEAGRGILEGGGVGEHALDVHPLHLLERQTPVDGRFLTRRLAGRWGMEPVGKMLDANSVAPA